MIDATGLDAKAGRQLRRVVAWSGGANRLIAAKVADAHAHAVKALTESLRSEPDGRATTGRVRRSRSAVAAGRRLDELLDGLTGPSIDSLDGLIRDARERFLIEAFGDHSALNDESGLRPNRTPTGAERKAIRRHELHGLPLRMEIGAVIDRYSRSLLPAIAQASNRDLGSRESEAILRTWATKATRAISASVGLALSDSSTFADTAAAWLILVPEERTDEDPPMKI